MKRVIVRGVAAVIAILAACSRDVVESRAPSAAPKDLAIPEERHLRHVRQLTFGGDHAEAYWSFHDDRLIMRTRHVPYRCDQIEELDVASGRTQLVSTGKGQATGSYFLWADQGILYASTHEASTACPTPPDTSNDASSSVLFDYDIFRADLDGKNPRKLTEAAGYDAEATVCPIDGSIVFTSMRSGDLELWRMDADGKNARQLTDAPGYDGGAFFSPDCTKIVWRASRPTGKDLEDYKALLAQKLVRPTKMDLFVANADGSEARQLTYLPGASFAPSFFPDGKRVMFSSNYLVPRGPDFDLFAIDIDGTHLERITYAGGFNGFPMFSLDGKQLAFSSSRRDVVKTDRGEVYRVTGAPAGGHETNVFVADWVDQPVAAATAPETAAADRFATAVRYLAADEREGRDVGTQGLTDAQAWVEQQLAAAGVEPGNAGAWRQPFQVTTAVSRKPTTEIAIDSAVLSEYDATPAASSASATASGEVVAVGWGIVDQATKLDDYKGKSVKGKIALVHRFLPPESTLRPGVKLDAPTVARLSDLHYKASLAHGKGAIGLIVVDDGDLSDNEARLPDLAAEQTEVAIPSVVITRRAAAVLAKGTHQARLAVALERTRVETSNVIGEIKAGTVTKLPGAIVVGAHLDHIGMGGRTALDPRVRAVHNGADDNASGVAGLLEVARAIGGQRAQLERDVYVVAFSAEEKGLLGSEYFVKHPPTTPVAAMINMDMIGRMRLNKLYVNGGESAVEWRDLVAPACAAQRIDCTVGGSGYGPSDHEPFYIAGSPVLFLFTGTHSDYHTATDDAERINAIGGARIAALAASVTLGAANAPALTYVKAPVEPSGGDLRWRGASLGLIPVDETGDAGRPHGMMISEVIPEGSAAKAGLQAGDRVVQLDSHEIAGERDMAYVLSLVKPGQEIKITYVRDGKTFTVTAIFGKARSRR